MLIPELTHLQFLLLDCLGDRELPGKELRALLAAAGVKKSGPVFYQFMSRMEQAKLVGGRYETALIDGMPLKRRFYRVSAAGKKALAGCRAFYRERLSVS